VAAADDVSKVVYACIAFTANANHEYSEYQYSDYEYSGFVKNGVPEKYGEIRWRSLHGYSGEFSNGKPHGKGTHFFPDGSCLRIQFVHNSPVGDGILRQIGPLGIDLHDVTYSMQGDVSIEGGATALKSSDATGEKYTVVRMPFKMLSVGNASAVAGAFDAKGEQRYTGNYPNLPPPDPRFNLSRQVIARCVWARPRHGDLPLWNAGEVQGNIVVMMRGPAEAIPTVSYALKLYNAQQAGAVGAVFIDWDTSVCLHTGLSQIDEGAIQGHPQGAVLKVQIPAVCMESKCLKGFQGPWMDSLEKAWMVFSSCIGLHSAGFGWQLGFLVFPPRQGTGGLRVSGGSAQRTKSGNSTAHGM